MYYKVTYNKPGFRFYEIIEVSQAADSKWHAMELAFAKNQEEFPERSYYKAKLLK